jgi:hypothetical protein
MAKTDSGLLGGSESESELKVRLLPEDVDDEAQYSGTKVEGEQVNDNGMGIFDESPPGVLLQVFPMQSPMLL